MSLLLNSLLLPTLLIIYCSRVGPQPYAPVNNEERCLCLCPSRASIALCLILDDTRACYNFARLPQSCYFLICLFGSEPWGTSPFVCCDAGLHLGVQRFCRGNYLPARCFFCFPLGPPLSPHSGGQGHPSFKGIGPAFMECWAAKNDQKVQVPH